MPQITLPDKTLYYDLYERLVAQSLGVTTDQSVAAATSILPRSCQVRNIFFPDLSPNTGVLIIKDRTDSELTRLDPDDAYPIISGSGANNIPLIGIKLRASGVDNSLVDIDVVVA